MLLRTMSHTSERPAEPQAAPPTPSLNSFVLNHQTQSKHQRRSSHLHPLLKSNGSTGSLASALRMETGVEAGPSHLNVMNRSNSASHELPPKERTDTWKRSSSMSLPFSPATLPVPDALTRPVTAPAPHLNGAAALLDPPTVEAPQQAVQQREWANQELTADVSQGDATQEADIGDGLVGGIPVYVMLPLDTVNAEGIFRHASSKWFLQALQALVGSGVHGIAIDVWWGAVEQQPLRYDWSGYRQLFELVKSMGLKIQAVLSFHACGGNVGDSAQIPLPRWVLQAGEQDPDLFFTDRPRESRRGQRNQEYISFWADEAPRCLRGRCPLECYTDFMRAFRDAFLEDLGDAIEEVVIGCGPCGELRYASYPEVNGWRFPGVGEFQCYDRRALASLAQAAAEAGHPEWGYTGPHDSGEYNSNPEETGFFCGWGGSWDTPYGRFFLDWYSSSLVQHGERLLKAASTIFRTRIRSKQLRRRSGRPVPDDAEAGSRASLRQGEQGTDPILSPGPSNSGITTPDTDSPNSARNSLIGKDGPASTRVHFAEDPDTNGVAGELSQNASSASLGIPQDASMSAGTSRTSIDEMQAQDGGQRGPNGQEDSTLGWPRMRPAGMRLAGKSISLASLATEESLQGGLKSTRSEDGEHRVVRMADAPAGKPVGITLKVAGVHWWFRTRAHAAELTAGYFNAGGRDGYRSIIDLCARYNATFTLTCVEMCDAQHPPEALCGPEGLLRQVREAAAEAGVEMGGENALPCFSPQHIDAAGLDRIVYNTQEWAPPLQEDAALKEALYNQRQPSQPAPEASSVPPLPDAVKLGFLKDPRFVRSGKLLQSRLPTMRGLTFLRLTPEMLTPSYQGAWLRFMHRMQANGRRARTLMQPDSVPPGQQ